MTKVFFNFANYYNLSLTSLEFLLLSVCKNSSFFSHSENIGLERSTGSFSLAPMGQNDPKSTQKLANKQFVV